MKRLFLLLASSAGALQASADDVRIFEEHFTHGQEQVCIIIDANGDGNTFTRHTQASWWGPDTDFEEMQYNSNNSSQAGDDWIITPGIELTAGRVYSFAVDARASFDGFAQRLEVCMGSDCSAEAMLTQVVAPTTITQSDYITLGNEIIVDSDGLYFFGIHALTSDHQELLYIDDIVISTPTGGQIPMAVTGLSVTPDAKGACCATITYTAPTLTTDAQPLVGLTKVEIARDGEVVGTQTGVAPGQTMTYTDYVPHNATYTYTVTAYADAKGMRATSDPVYIGVDIPQAPQWLRATDNGTSVDLSWAPTSSLGIHSQYVNLQEVIYIVQTLDANNFANADIAHTAQNACRYNINTRQSSGQDLLRFGVTATNSAGWSDYAFTRIVVGAPYCLPFHESFSTGVFKSLVWKEGEGDFVATTAFCADGDAGCISCKAQRDGEQTTLCLGKVSLGQAQHPLMRCKYMMTGAQDHAEVCAFTADGSCLTLAQLDGRTDGWQDLCLDLSPLAGADYVIPKFSFTGSLGETMAIDDIVITDPYDYDLAIGLDTLAPGADAVPSVVVTVSNLGLLPVSNYDVALTVEGLDLDVLHDADVLAPGQQRTFCVRLDAAALANASAEVRAAIVCLYDLNELNDVATLVVDKMTILPPAAVSVSHQRSMQQMAEAANLAIRSTEAVDARLAPIRQSTLDVLYRSSSLAVLGYAEGGYAIVSTDDRLPLVLGYSASKLDSDNPHFTWWLRTMEAAVHDHISRGESAQQLAPQRYGYPDQVPQMLSTVWGQMEPYNDLCPIVDGGRALVGCVATAMTQIMNYHKYPTQGTGIYTDMQTTDAAGNVIPVTIDFADYVFDYSLMRDSYTPGNYTQAEAHEVAELSFAVGASFGMIYGTSASGTFSDSAAHSLRQHLGFPQARMLSRYNYSDYEWMDIIYDELSHGRPLMYSGADDIFTLGGGGHAFVFDGYDANGLVHVNWGWYGSCDGYYDVSLLNPSQHSFRNQQDMVIGCCPPSHDGELRVLDLSDMPLHDGMLPALACYGSDAHRIILPAGVTQIGDGAFAHCPYLTEVVFPEANERQQFVVDDNIIYSADRTEVIEVLPYYHNNRQVQSGYTSLLTLPEGVTTIHAHAFDGCFRIKGIELPASVSRIGQRAFLHVSNLRCILVHSTTPARAEVGAFDGIDVGYTRLAVPAATSDLYMRAGEWSRFFRFDNVVETGTYVRARSFTHNAGDPLPALSYEMRGNWVEGEPELSCQVDASSSAGTYPIRVGIGSLLGSDIALTDGRIIVVQPEAIEQIHHDAPASSSYSITGLRLKARPSSHGLYINNGKIIFE